jgi:hypothetical protein
MYFKIPTNPKIVETPVFDAAIGSARPYVAGFEMAVTGLTTFTIQPGCARDVATPSNIPYPPINAAAPGIITVDVSTIFVPPNQLDANGNPVTPTPVGFGGCFPLPLSQAGLAGNNTVMPVFAIGASDGTLPTAAIVPTNSAFLPAGYNTFARIGYVFINGTTFQIIPAIQTGHYERREYQFANAVVALTAGAAGTATLVDLTSGNGLVPPGVSEVNLSALFTPGAAADQARLNAAGQTSTTYPVVLQGSAALATQVSVSMLPGIDATTGDAGVNYLVTGADTLSLWVAGFTDDMAVQIN